MNNINRTIEVTVRIIILYYLLNVLVFCISCILYQYSIIFLIQRDSYVYIIICIIGIYSYSKYLKNITNEKFKKKLGSY